jgi:hypothetical protein
MTGGHCILWNWLRAAQHPGCLHGHSPVQDLDRKTDAGMLYCCMLYCCMLYCSYCCCCFDLSAHATAGCACSACECASLCAISCVDELHFTHLMQFVHVVSSKVYFLNCTIQGNVDLCRVEFLPCACHSMLLCSMYAAFHHAVLMQHIFKCWLLLGSDCADARSGV